MQLVITTRVKAVGVKSQPYWPTSVFLFKPYDSIISKQVILIPRLKDFLNTQINSPVFFRTNMYNIHFEIKNKVIWTRCILL